MHVRLMSRLPKQAGLLDIRTTDVQEVINIFTLIQNFLGLDFANLGPAKDKSGDSADDEST